MIRATLLRLRPQGLETFRKSKNKQIDEGNLLNPEHRILLIRFPNISTFILQLCSSICRCAERTISHWLDFNCYYEQEFKIFWQSCYFHILVLIIVNKQLPHSAVKKNQYTSPRKKELSAIAAADPWKLCYNKQQTCIYWLRNLMKTYDILISLITYIWKVYGQLLVWTKICFEK